MRTFIELVERYVDPEICLYPEYKGKPYYSIKYIENGEVYLGYSTYSMQVMSGFLKKYFMSSALEKQEQVNTQSVNLTHTTYPNALESLKILESAKDENGCVPMSLVRLAFRNVLEQDGWIPCSVRLPVEKDAGILKKLGTDKRSDYVIATVEVKGERMTVTACTYDGKWDWNMKYAFPDYKVIAWMPLPAPYQEDEA